MSAVRTDFRQIEKNLAGEFIELFPDEAALKLEGLPPDEINQTLRELPLPRAAALLARLTPSIGAEVIGRMDPEFSRKVLSGLDPVRAVQILPLLNPEELENRLNALDPQRARILRSFLSYPDDRAGRFMDPRVPVVRPDLSVREVLGKVRNLGRRRVGDIYVVNVEGVFLGTVPLQDIAVAPPFERIGNLVRDHQASVHAMADREEVLELMERSRMNSLPVLDFEGRFLGAIRQDVFMTAAQEEVSADIQTMVGVSKEERAFSPVGFAVRKRLPWLHVNLATAFLAAAVVGLFEDTIARFTALAVLLPVVAGQAGNTGAQALAITMRGLSLREVRIYQWTRLFFKELRVAFVNGTGVALSTSFFVYLWSGSAGLSLIIGSSMVISMVAAGISGVVIPVFLSSIGQDPAQSSSIILTTVTDVAGFLSFLGFATMMSGMI